jgi:hypothetical protein
MPIARWWSSNGSHGLDFAAVSRHFAFTKPNTPNDTTHQTSPGSREGHPGDTPTRPATTPLISPRGSGVRRVGDKSAAGPQTGEVAAGTGGRTPDLSGHPNHQKENHEEARHLDRRPRRSRRWRELGVEALHARAPKRGVVGELNQNKPTPALTVDGTGLAPDERRVYVFSPPEIDHAIDRNIEAILHIVAALEQDDLDVETRDHLLLAKSEVTLSNRKLSTLIDACQICGESGLKRVCRNCGSRRGQS